MSATETRYVEDLVDRDDDFDRWYVDVVRKAELADDAPVRGCKVDPPVWIWPVGADGGRGSMPGSRRPASRTPPSRCLIPQSMLEREAEHIEGFAPEVAWVTRGRQQASWRSRWAIRPTSEAIICPMLRAVGVRATAICRS